MKYGSVKDSGKRQEFGTGSVRDTRDGKGRYDLLPSYPIERLAQHYENGAKKYGDNNWRRGQPLSRYLDSALRHTFKYLEGFRDEDHLAAAAWNLIGVIYTEEMIRRGELPKELDDLCKQSTSNQRATSSASRSKAKRTPRRKTSRSATRS